ncbi:relaxase/mobilization nuclease domain-containing protein [Acidimangrovimonas sediminis]|uniref:relaxase/mobilization nuclease domain-containing protein n=1 Tax=Acidimangrovimonas sediminis TaxID=2056283 RepID=UPI001304877B|nr:relaxase/mobilization nuclease domain-containing protein [Acidimangrovimonas sediminis]
MIPKIIQRRTYDHQGRDAFAATITYAVEKASGVETRHVVGDWHDAARQMQQTAELGRRQTSRVLYHISLSWPEQERPSHKQMFDAADQVIAALGAQDHEAVLAIHDDTGKRHIHIVLNRFHMASGRLLSTSNDFAILERACREIEIAQGWSADRGRFDVRLDRDQNVTLVQKPAVHWKRKAEHRAAGLRSQGEAERRRSRGAITQPLSARLSAPLKSRIRRALDTAQDWSDVTTRLDQLGLSLRPFGSGARLYVDHAGDHMRASALGAPYSGGKLTKQLGDIPQHVPRRARLHLEKAPAKLRIEGWSGMPEAELFSTQSVRNGRQSQVFTRITANERILRHIEYIALRDIPRRIVLVGGAHIEDLGSKIVATNADMPEIAAFIMMTIAYGHGWTTIRAIGPGSFCRACARAGDGLAIKVEGFDAPPKKTIEGATTTWLERRAKQHAQTKTQRDQIAAQKRCIKEDYAESEAALKAAFGSARAPVVQALRGALKAQHADKLASAGDARKSKLRLAPLDAAAIITASPGILKLRRKKEIEDQFSQTGILDHTSIRQLLEYCRISMVGEASDADATESRAIDHPLLGPLLPHISSTGAVVGHERARPQRRDPLVPGGRRGLGIFHLPSEPCRVMIFESFPDILRTASKMENLDFVGLVSVAGETPCPDAKICLRKLRARGCQFEVAPNPETKNTQRKPTTNEPVGPDDPSSGP